MIGVLDRRGLVDVFNANAGRRFVGAIDCGDCLELVFEDRGEAGGNLVTIFTAGRRRGLVAQGFVSQEWIDGGYGRPGCGQDEAAA